MRLLGGLQGGREPRLAQEWNGMEWNGMVATANGCQQFIGCRSEPLCQPFGHPKTCSDDTIGRSCQEHGIGHAVVGGWLPQVRHQLMQSAAALRVRLLWTGGVAVLLGSGVMAHSQVQRPQ